MSGRPRTTSFADGAKPGGSANFPGMKTISKCLDFVSVMAYLGQGSWKPYHDVYCFKPVPYEMHLHSVIFSLLFMKDRHKHTAVKNQISA